MREQLVDYIQAKGSRYITFVELSKKIEGFAGELSYGASETYPARVIWAGLSQEAIDLIEELDGDTIFLHPCTQEDYPEESRPQLPEFDFGARTRTEPSWLPMAFRNEPY